MSGEVICAAHVVVSDLRDNRFDLIVQLCCQFLGEARTRLLSDLKTGGASPSREHRGKHRGCIRERRYQAVCG